MPDPRDLEARLQTLEKAAVSPRGRFTASVFVLMGIAGCVLLLFQVWVMQRQWESLRNRERERLFWTLCQPSASVSERTTAFRQLAADGHREWRSASSQGLDLRESVLDGAHLQLVDLTACDLRSASLVGADFSGARLRTADLSGADLSESVFDGADCLKAILDGSDFREAKMRNCSLEQTQAQGATFVLADLSESILLMADLSEADLTSADLTACTLESAKLRGATLFLTNLANADLRNVDLTDSNWWRARGLTKDQLLDLAAEFPPTQSAGASRVKDFRLWIESFTGAAEDASERRPDNGK